LGYHKVISKFLQLADIQNENPDAIEIYEFKGEDFDLVA
jgi:hypothetical protein